MSRPSKEYQNRMEGMVAALNIAKSGGVEALERDIRMRGFLRAPLKMTTKELDEFTDFVTRNVYSTTMSVWFMTFVSELGFGKKRLHRLKEAFDKNTMQIVDFDYLGNHYTSLEDYAVYLNEKYNCGIDVMRVSMCQEASSYEQEKKHMANVWELINVLRENGYEEAAVFIEKKI